MRTVLIRWGISGGFIAMCAVFSAVQPHTFPTWANAADILNSAVPFIMFGTLVTLVLMLSEFDLSFPYIADLTSILVGLLVTLGGMRSGVGLAVALVCGLVLAGGVGFANGLFVSGGRIPSFVVTLAVGSIAGGAQLALQAKIPGGLLQISSYSVPASLRTLTVGHFAGGLQAGLLIAAVTAAGAVFWIHATVTGRQIRAVGGNAHAAFLASVPVGRVRIGVFVCAGILAGLTGIVDLGAQGYYNGASPPLLLQVYTAAFLGKAFFASREFTVAGTVLAVLFLQTLTNGLNLANAPTWIVSAVSGVVLLTAVAGTVGRRL